MFDCKLIPSIILLSAPRYMQSVIISIIYTISIIWISHHYNVLIVSGAAIGEVFLILIGITTILGFTSPLSTICNIAYKNQDYEMIGIFLQRSMIISHLLFICLALVFLFSDYILIYMLRQPFQTSFYASIYLRFMIIALWMLFVWTNLRRFLQCQKFTKYTVITIIFGLFGEIFGLYLFQTIFKYGYYGAILSVCFGFFCQLIAMCILIIIVGYYNAYHINKFTIDEIAMSNRPGHHIGLSDVYYSQGVLKGIHEHKQESSHDINKLYFHFIGWYGINCKAVLNIKGFKYLLSLCVPGVCRIYSQFWTFTFIEIIIAGWISMEYLTAQTLTHNILSLIIKIQISTASATSVLIRKSISRKNISLAKNIWDTSMIYGFIITSILCSVIYFEKDVIAKFYILIGEHTENDMESRYIIYNLMNNIALPWMCVYLVINSQLLINQG
eukprot:201227_1